MPNFCGFDMKIAGPEPAVMELVSLLQTKDPYTGLGRVFSFDLDDSMTEKDPRGGDLICVQGFGDCAWSLDSSMRDGCGFPRTLEKECERLGLVVEAFSSEPGCCFQEHLLIAKDDIVIDETEKYEEHLIDGATEEYIQNLCDEKHLTREQLMSKLNHNGEYTVGGVENYCEFGNLFRYLEVEKKPSLASVISNAQQKQGTSKDNGHISQAIERG